MTGNRRIRILVVNNFSFVVADVLALVDEAVLRVSFSILVVLERAIRSLSLASTCVWGCPVVEDVAPVLAVELLSNPLEDGSSAEPLPGLLSLAMEFSRLSLPSDEDAARLFNKPALAW
jgi:hypothetical protein